MANEELWLMGSYGSWGVMAHGEIWLMGSYGSWRVVAQENKVTHGYRADFVYFCAIQFEGLFFDAFLFVFEPGHEPSFYVRFL